MKLRLNAELFVPPKKRLFVDMDGVLVDFDSGVNRLNNKTRATYGSKPKDAPGVFSLMDPMPGAIDAINRLADKFDVFILTTAPWNNPSAWSDKLNWVKQHLGSKFEKRLIITHRKDLLNGDFLIDDWDKHGASEFNGEWIQFGSAKFPDWNAVEEYLYGKIMKNNSIFTSVTDFYKDWDALIKSWLACNDSFGSQNPLACLNDVKKTLSLQHLPEPYYGNMNKPSIVIINLNPGTGLCEQCHIRQNVPGILVNYVNNNNSYSNMAKGFPLDGKSKVPMPAESLKWWESRLDWINRILDYRLKQLNVNIDKKKLDKKKPFALELVPLHSKSFKVSNAGDYVSKKYTIIGDVIEYAIVKSKAQMGLAIGKPIFDVLTKDYKYKTIAGDPSNPLHTQKKERDYRVIKSPKGRLILCTWASGSNKAPSKDFEKDEENIIKTYFSPNYHSIP